MQGPTLTVRTQSHQAGRYTCICLGNSRRRPVRTLPEGLVVLDPHTPAQTRSESPMAAPIEGSSSLAPLAHPRYACRMIRDLPLPGRR